VLNRRTRYLNLSEPRPSGSGAFNPNHNPVHNPTAPLPDGRGSVLLSAHRTTWTTTNTRTSEPRPSGSGALSPTHDRVHNSTAPLLNSRGSDRSRHR